MSFFISLFLHLAVLMGMTLVWVTHPKPDKKPAMYVPSYTYREPAHSFMREQPAQKNVLADKLGVEKRASSQAVQLRHASQAQTNTTTQVMEAIHLVGDKKNVPKPLIKLLGRALAAHLVYPKIAVDFKLHGVSYIAFVLHADGRLTDVRLIQSSRVGVLDDEAITAVSAISPLKNANPYIDQAKPMVVGIIFN